MDPPCGPAVDLRATAIRQAHLSRRAGERHGGAEPKDYCAQGFDEDRHGVLRLRGQLVWPPRNHTNAALGHKRIPSASASATAQSPVVHAILRKLKSFSAYPADTMSAQALLGDPGFVPAPGQCVCQPGLEASSPLR